jgi:hypothetical protein
MQKDAYTAKRKLVEFQKSKDARINGSPAQPDGIAFEKPADGVAVGGSLLRS